MVITRTEITYSAEEFDKWMKENSQKIVHAGIPKLCLIASFLNDNSEESNDVVFDVGTYGVVVQQKDKVGYKTISHVPQNGLGFILVRAFDEFGSKEDGGILLNRFQKVWENIKKEVDKATFMDLSKGVVKGEWAQLSTFYRQQIRNLIPDEIPSYSV